VAGIVKSVLKPQHIPFLAPWLIPPYFDFSNVPMASTFSGPLLPPFLAFQRFFSGLRPFTSSAVSGFWLWQIASC
jgi:hypothetical protein